MAGQSLVLAKVLKKGCVLKALCAVMVDTQLSPALESSSSTVACAVSQGGGETGASS